MKRNLKILIAPDSFKGSISAIKVTEIIERELTKSKLQLSIKQFPLADGGEGSLEAIQLNTSFQSIQCKVFDPLFKEIEANYFFDKENETSYIELAKASGFYYIKDKPDIMHSSTFGTGQLIKHSIGKGAKKVVLFIGGSATNDAGLGILEALGFEFLDLNEKKIKPLPINIPDIKKVDSSNSILLNKNIEIILAADVTNSFYGPSGAAYVYSPQKGASHEEVRQLDAGLQHLAKLISETNDFDIQEVEGAGAAGGVGGGLHAFTEAKIVSGAKLIFDILRLEEKIKEADIIISGEGKIDRQSLNSKLLLNISKLVKKHKKELWAICGCFAGDNKLKEDLYINRLFSLAKVKEENPGVIQNVESELSKISKSIIEEIKVKLF